MKKAAMLFLGVGMVLVLTAPARAEESREPGNGGEWSARHQAMEQFRQKLEPYRQKMEQLRGQMQQEMEKVRQIREQMKAVHEQMQQAKQEMVGKLGPAMAGQAQERREAWKMKRQGMQVPGQAGQQPARSPSL